MLKAGTPQRVDNDPIGTGPFQLVQYQKDAKILYKAFDRYWEGKPKIDRLVFSITPDATVRYAKLQRTSAVMPFPNPADLARMRQDGNLQVMEKSGLNIGFTAFNTQKNRWITSRCAGRWRWRSTSRRSSRRCSTAPASLPEPAAADPVGQQRAA